MQDREYYSSERFIWDNLKVQVATSVVSIYDTWKKEGKIKPFLVSWPGETLLDDHGVPFQGACLLDLPDNQSKWLETVVTFAKRTKAYALLLTEQKEREVHIILESHHGTRSWTIPILVSGDLRTLGTAAIKDDTHKIGVLWRTRSRSN